MSTKYFFENQIVAGFVPVDMQTGANDSDWVSLKNFQRCVCILFKAIGTAGGDPVFTLQQATDVSGTAAKDLLFENVFSKVGTQSSIGNFTLTEQVAATSFTDATSAEAQAIIGVEILSSMLDVDGGFSCIQLSIPDVDAAAQLGCGLYILSGSRHAGDLPPSAIA